MRAMRSRCTSDFLVARPSFWSGIARVIDMFGVFDGYNASRSPAEADARALACDWWVTGDALRDAHDSVREGEGRQIPLFDVAHYA